MTRTSKALKRLGVAVVAVATIGAGAPALIATGANAATTDPTTITVTPTSQSAGTGTCQVFTVKITDATGKPATGTVSVTLTDPSPATPTASTVNPSQASAQFCTVDGSNEPVPAGASTSSAANKRTLTQNTTTGTVKFGVNDTEVETVGLFAFIDTNGNGVFDAGQDYAATTQPSATFTAGNDNTTGAFSQQANDNVKTITDVSKSGSVNITVKLTNASGDVVTGARPQYQYQAGSANGGATATAAGPAGTCGVSDNDGIAVCTLNPTAGGTDKITVWVNQNPPNGVTPGPDANEPQITVTRTSAAPAADATTVTVTPTGQTFGPGSTIRYTAKVTDKNGNPVQGANVTWSISGVGSFVSGSSTGATDASGTTSIQTTTASNDQGTQTVKAANTTSTACAPASAPATCTGTATNTISATSATPTPSSSTTPPAGAKPVLSTSTPDIQPNQQGKLTATGVTANAVYELRCYSRPSTTYFTARTVTAGATDTSVSFTILPGTNTRCYVRPQGDEANASNSVVINVHTTLSLSAYRDGVRQYHFQGTNLPRRSGQLITLYRWARADNNGYCDPHVAANDYTATSTDPNCIAIRTATATTDSSNVWRIDRTFTGSGQFVFMAKTSQNLTNAAGVSNLRLTIIH